MRGILEAMQTALALVGVISLCAFGWLEFERSFFGARYLEQFEEMRATVESPALPVAASAEPDGPAPPAPRRLDVRRPTRATDTASVLARLRADRIGLEVPVLEGVEDRTLRRGAGWIPGTARPGEAGNVGIAAHRDTFFRPLRQIRSGDHLELDTPEDSQSYTVSSVYVVGPDFTGALKPTAEPTLTLVTCFPFDYVGPAPRRFVVHAVLDHPD